MLKLLKYEWRKTAFLKYGLLVITALAEIAFLFGIFLQKEVLLAISVMALVLITLGGIIMVGINSIQLLYKELNSKQSYMLFMTPNSSYAILGAKVLESAISILITSLLFGVLAIADLQLVKIFVDPTMNVIALIFDMFGITSLAPLDIIASVISYACIFLFTFVTAYLAVIISATLLNGNKFGGWLSLAIYLGINICVSYIMYNIFGISMDTSAMLIPTIVDLVLASGFYFVSCYLMDTQLSVKNVLTSGQNMV